MNDFIKILDNIKKFNYEQFHVSALATALKNTVSPPAIEFFSQFYDTAIKAFEKKMFVEAIYILAYCYNNGYLRDEIYKFIIGNYYLPFVDRYEKTYTDNINALKNYEFICSKDFTNFSELDFLFLPMDLEFYKIHEGYLKYSKKEDKFEAVASFVIDIKKSEEIKDDLEGQRVFLYNVYDTNFILWMHKKTHYNLAFALRTPNHLYYDSRNDFIQHLQIIDFTECLKIKKAVFIFGEAELESFLLKPENLTSNLVFYHHNFHAQAKKVYEFINSINQKKNQLYDETVEKLNDYYSQLTPEAIHEKILNKTARIVFMVSKCTTAIRYYIRDCHEACKSLGITSEIFTEKNEISAVSGSNRHEMADFLLNYKPDIMIIIDHFRWEWAVIPKQLVFICWIQDLLPNLFDPKSASKIEKLDFILTPFLKHPKFQAIGYPKQKLIYHILPASPNYYKKYELSEDERERYSTDVCVVSNSGHSEDVLKTVILPAFKTIKDHVLQNTVQKLYYEMYNVIFNDIYNDKKYYYHDDIQKIFNEFFINRYKLTMFSTQIKEFAFTFWGHLMHAVYKDIPILWLHEKGYNMKLWGLAWMTHPILKKYSMGIAQNGETLSKILNASKISVGVGGGGTFHPRIVEAYFSGCLYIGNDLPKNEDLAIARDFLKAGKEIIFYKNRKDLYGKIDYYLSNENARQAVISAGSKKSHETLTYEAVMTHVLGEIEKKLAAPTA